jgi:glycerol-3-phosphate dehydrogenase (NAD(P)+)
MIVSMFRNISIIGDGGMGTVMSMLLCAKKKHVRMWGYDREQLLETADERENRRFLPGYKVPKNLEFEPEDEKIMKGADLILSAVPCQYIRSVWTRLKKFTPDNIPIVSVAKGIENGTLLRPTEIISDVLELSDSSRLGVLSGPTIADELARKLPATACAAGKDEKLIRQIQKTFSTTWFRVYTNTDIVGVELAGAMKNIIAIAAGMIDGTKAGDNCKAALVTRGLAEIMRLGTACGARHETFIGLTGLGDLVTTCISPTGRNRSFGEKIGKGHTIEQAQKSTDSVVEGIATCESVVALAQKKGVEMPITQAVYEILFRNKPVKQAIFELMNRKLKAEV